MDVHDVFRLINLDHPGLEAVKKAIEQGDADLALELYLKFMVNRKDVVLYLNEDIKDVSKYCVENFENDTKEILVTANKVVNNTFVFRFKWDMERTNVPVTFTDEIKWDNIPFDDEEWIFMLNRHRFWIALGQAYSLTGNEIYAEAFFAQLEHWIDTNKRTKESCKSTWRTIEAGIRCENWIKSFMYFRNSKQFNSNILAKFIISLHDHAEYIHESYDNFRKLSNWGVLESHGLFIVSVFLPELLECKKYRGDSLLRLKEQINLQVMRDGMQWEQSPMYHNEVLHCYLDTIILADKNNISLHNDILCRTRDLAFADLYMAKPNHHQPMQSDSDDTDLRDMITKAAYIFKDGKLKFGAYASIDFESIWDLGYKSIFEYEKIKVEMPDYTSYGFEDSGNYYMRSGWNENDNYLYFHCGTLGSGHGHADLLHFDIHAFGESVLIDSGRYTYVEGNKYREYLKSCRAHNTTVVDNTDFTLLDESWKVSKAAWPIKQRFITHEEFDYAEGGHLGYMDLHNPVFTNRKIIFIKPNCWIVVDEFYTTGEHNYKQLFHFDYGKLTDKLTHIEFLGKKAKLKLISLNNNMQKEITSTCMSKEYNKLEEGKKLICNIDGNGFISLITVIYAEALEGNSNITCEKIKIYKADGKQVENEEAEAIKIILQQEEYIVVVSHGEACRGKKLYVVEDIPAYGKAILIKKSNDETNVLTMRY